MRKKVRADVANFLFLITGVYEKAIKPYGIYRDLLNYILHNLGKIIAGKYGVLIATQRSVSNGLRG